MTATDSAYAFHPSHMQLRRHFKSNQTVAESTNSVLVCLYSPSGPRVEEWETYVVGHQDTNNGSGIRTARATRIIRIAKCTSGHPSAASIFIAKNLIRLKLQTWNSYKELPDHSRTARQRDQSPLLLRVRRGNNNPWRQQPSQPRFVCIVPTTAGSRES